MIRGGRKGIAGFIGIHEKTFDRWRKILEFPSIGPKGSHLKAMEEKIIEWLEKIKKLHKCSKNAPHLLHSKNENKPL